MATRGPRAARKPHGMITLPSLRGGRWQQELVWVATSARDSVPEICDSLAGGWVPPVADRRLEGLGPSVTVLDTGPVPCFELKILSSLAGSPLVWLDVVVGVGVASGCGRPLLCGFSGSTEDRGRRGPAPPFSEGPAGRASWALKWSLHPKTCFISTMSPILPAALPHAWDPSRTRVRGAAALPSDHLAPGKNSCHMLESLQLPSRPSRSQHFFFFPHLHTHQFNGAYALLRGTNPGHLPSSSPHTNSRGPCQHPIYSLSVIFGCVLWFVGFQFSSHGTKPKLWQWKPRVPTTRPPGTPSLGIRMVPAAAWPPCQAETHVQGGMTPALLVGSEGCLECRLCMCCPWGHGTKSRSSCRRNLLKWFQWVNGSPDSS